MVNALRQQFLTGSGFAVDKDRSIVQRGLLRSGNDLPKDLIFTVNVVKGIAFDADRLRFILFGARFALALRQLQQGIRHLPNIGDILGNFHRGNRFAIRNDGNRAVDRCNLFAVEIFVGLLLAKSRIVFFECFEHRALAQTKIRKSFVELLSQYVLNIDFFHRCHRFVVEFADTVLIDNVYALVNQLNQRFYNLVQILRFHFASFLCFL